MKKKDLTILLLTSAFLAGCGNAAGNVMTESMDTVQMGSVESTHIENVESESSETATDMTEEASYTERGNLYLLENVQHNPENNVDVGAMALNGKSYTLVKSVNIFHTDSALAGYTKEDFQVRVVAGDDEWSYCDLGTETENYLVKTDELMEAISEQDKQILLAVTATPTPAPTEAPKTEIPPVASTPVDAEPVIDVPVVVEPVIEEPAVVESDKYTPEEAIAIYRSIMEENGITWDPSIKDGGSWGTGFIFLDKGQPEWAGATDVKSCEMGDSGGNPYTKYYLEVTGSDEDCVYIIVWSN